MAKEGFTFLKSYYLQLINNNDLDIFIIAKEKCMQKSYFVYYNYHHSEVMSTKF